MLATLMRAINVIVFTGILVTFIEVGTCTIAKDAEKKKRVDRAVLVSIFGG